MRKYTFYFTIFGIKKKWSTKARNENEARVKLDDFISNSLVIDKTDSSIIETDPFAGFEDFFKGFPFPRK